MKINVFLMAIFFLAAVFCGSALAAEDSGATYGSSGPPSATNHALQGERGVPTQYGNENPYLEPATRVHTQMHRASNLIGRNLFSRQGQDLGEIQNLVIAPNGQVQYIVLSRGGVGTGGKLVPVPWQAAHLQVTKNKMTADITRQQVRNAPSFSKDRWNRIDNPGYEHRVNSYYGSRTQSPPQSNLQSHSQSTVRFSKVYPGSGVVAHGQ